MRALRIASLVLLGALLPALMAPTGGIPSRPRFQSVGIGATPATGNALTVANNNVGNQIIVRGGSAGASNVAYVRFQDSAQTSVGYVGDAGGAENDMYLAATVSGASINLNTVGTGLVRVNSVDITPTTGTFVVTFDDACTTSPTVTYTYLKSGNEVTIQPTASSGFPCTGDSTSFATTATPVPAALRPATNPVNCQIQAGFQDNGATTLAAGLLGTSGTFQYSRITTTSTTWTAAGNRIGPGLQAACTYLTNN